MKRELEVIQGILSDSGSRMEITEVYPGIELTELSIRTEKLTFRHEPYDRVLEINYCRSGRIGWQMAGGSTVYLGPGDFTVHTMRACADSVMTFPNEVYEGLTLCMDLDALNTAPPEILKAAGITGDSLYARFGQGHQSESFIGSETTERIFAGFYEAPDHLRQAYRLLYAQALILFLSDVKQADRRQPDELSAEQVAAVRTAHDYLLAHLDERITIGELARLTYLNPTTLKAVFKSVYGSSLAAHIREHRMEKAAALLTETDDSIASVAKAVGYDSQSRFTEAFRETYRVVPTVYRKNAARKPGVPDGCNSSSIKEMYVYEQEKQAEEP